MVNLTTNQKLAFKRKNIDFKRVASFWQSQIEKKGKITFLIFHRNKNETHISRAGSFPNMEVEQRLRGRIVRRPKEQVWMLKTDSVI